MIYFFAGDDSKTKYKNYEKLMESYPQEVEIFHLNRNSLDENQIESLSRGEGLFFKKSATVFSEVLEKEETRDFIFSKLPILSESKNDFIFLEGKLSKAILDEFKKARAELNIFELPKEKKEKYDNFVLAYDLSNRDKLSLWVHFRQAMDLGVSLEELVGILFWKAKDMILKKDFRKFKEVELKNLAGKLAYLLPEARKHGIDDETSLEKFLLEAF